MLVHTETNNTSEESSDTLLFLELENLRVCIIRRAPCPLAVEKLFLPHTDLCFSRKKTWCFSDHAMPSNFLSPKSWVLELSSEVSFVSVLAIFLSEYLILFPPFPQNDEIYKKIFSPAFFNILKEPLLVQKQTIPQKKVLIPGFLELESLKAEVSEEILKWHSHSLSLSAELWIIFLWLACLSRLSQ